MLGSEFVSAFKDKGVSAWEAAALSLAQQGSTVSWPLVSIPVATKDGQHSGVLQVASDLFSIGTVDDYLRLPLTPKTAQSIANLTGSLLPTPKISQLIWQNAATLGIQLLPRPQNNRGANLSDYALHDATIDQQLQAAGKTGLISGHKKDVIVSNIAKPQKVLIYGWFWPASMTQIPAGFSQPIQARSNIHGDFYVDYSHGIRLVSPQMMVDGATMLTEDVLRDPTLSSMLSDEGPLRFMRYPASNDPQPFRPATLSEYKVLSDVYPRPNTTSLADQGLAELAARKTTP